MTVNRAISKRQRLAAGKAWFRMTSEGGKWFIPGMPALYSRLFVFDEQNQVTLRPGITSDKALAEIGDGRGRKRRREQVAKFQEKKALSKRMVLLEGSLLKKLVSVYVRDSSARQQCIENYGCKCFICNFSFKQVYGQIGEGFIHVHHLRQLSNIRKIHKIDPIRDLRPVCPNCHAVLHLRRPEPFSVEEIKSLLR